MDQFDVIISSITTEKPILESDAFYSVMKRTKDSPIFLIDLGVPRNFDEGVGEVPEIYLYNINDLANIVNENENLKSRQFEIERCRALLSDRIEHVWNAIVRNYPEKEDSSVVDVEEEGLTPVTAN